jgi:hypothetical protein
MNSHTTRFLVAALAALALACGPKPRQGEGAIEEAAALGDGRVIVGGCLREASDAGQFLLANAQLAFEPAGMLIDAPEPPPLPTGEGPITTGIPVVTRSPDYVLQPPAEIDLRPHVGRQVQVTAVLDPASDAPAVEQANAAGLLRAQEVRLIADRCIGY